jgi:hypothetical protein
MSTLAQPADRFALFIRYSPWLLVMGLMLVTWGQYSPFAPLLLGVGLLMLGSTAAVSQRLPARFTGLGIALNLLAYLALYGLFLGVLTSPTPFDQPLSPPWLRLADLGTSSCAVFLSLQFGLRHLERAA